MKPITKRIFIFSAVTAVSGLILMGVGMGLGGRPGVLFSKEGIQTPYQEKKPYFQKKTQLDPFHTLNLSIDSDAQIRVLPSNDKNYYIEYLLDGNYQKPHCEVTDDTLYFSQTDSQNFMVGMFGIQFGSSVQSEPSITLYLPEGTELKQTQIYTSYGDISLSSANLGDASIETASGNISLKDTTAGTLQLLLEDGDCLVDGVTADTFTLNNEYGDTVLKNTTSKSASLELDSGNLELNQFSTDTLKIYSEDGNVQTENLSFQSADITLEYGDLELDVNTLETLTCNLDSGGLILTLPDSMRQYQCDFHLEYGDLTLPEDAPKDRYQEEDGEVIYQTQQTNDNKNRRITIQSEDGDVQIQYP